jgi:Xaa-Pro dipeptidase
MSAMNLTRMRAERRLRLRDVMSARSLDAVMLLSPGNQAYAGLSLPRPEAGRLHYLPSVVLVTAREVHVWSADLDAALVDQSDVVAHPAMAIEHAEGAADLLGAVRDIVGRRTTVAVDELSAALLLLFDAEAGLELLDAEPCMVEARAVKTPDEIACIRAAEAISESASALAYDRLRPGIREHELTEVFLRRVCELGGEGNIDPIWSMTSMTPSVIHSDDVPDLAYPRPGNDRILRDGQVILCDNGIQLHDYHSDYGRTWIVGHDPRPNLVQREVFERWLEVIQAVREVLKPGSTGADLVAAATAVERRHAQRNLYLAHGIGLDAVEYPLIGSDRGAEADAKVVLGPGMVIVLEPIIWREHQAAYRAEQIVAITDDGFESLTNLDLRPFAEPTRSSR